MPWCTYTVPEIAHVGLYEFQAKEKGYATDSYKFEMAENDAPSPKAIPMGL